MIVKIVRGIGAPGKLWTGDIPESGEVVDARIFERVCTCGAVTRKLRVNKLENVSAIAEACEIPTLLVTMGGVGSVSLSTEEGGESIPNPQWLQLQNWSKRVGGHAILSPVATLSGYWNEKEIPPAKEGFRWIRTYGGSTLSEFVLIKVDEDGGGHHGLPVVELEGKCPPCRDKEAVVVVEQQAVVV